jgi:hypothetical protein
VLLAHFDALPFDKPQNHCDSVSACAAFARFDLSPVADDIFDAPHPFVLPAVPVDFEEDRDSVFLASEYFRPPDPIGSVSRQDLRRSIRIQIGPKAPAHDLVIPIWKIVLHPSSKVAADLTSRVASAKIECVCHVGPLLIPAIFNPFRVALTTPLLRARVFWLGGFLSTWEPDSFGQPLFFKFQPDRIIPGVSHIGQSVGHSQRKENGGVRPN